MQGIIKIIFIITLVSTGFYGVYTIISNNSSGNHHGSKIYHSGGHARELNAVQKRAFQF